MKQIKTSHLDLKEIFKHGIKVRHISEEFVSCCADEDAAIVRERIRTLDFDVMEMEKDGSMCFGESNKVFLLNMSEE